MLKRYPAHSSLLPFYLSWKTTSNKSDYNLCFSYFLPTKEDAKLLSDKLQEIVQLKAYLRQTFTFENGCLMATIHEKLPAEIDTIIIDSTEFSQIEKGLVKRVHNLHHHSAIFLTIVRFNDSDHCIVLFNIHHIIMDGVSLDNFINDLNKLLNKEHVSEELAEDYIKNIAYEPSIEDESETASVVKYNRHLQKLSDKTNLSTNAGGTELHYVKSLSNEIFLKLNYFSQHHSISVFNLLLIAQGIFLAKIFNEDFSLTYYPVNIRKNKYVNGCFVNLIAYPLNINAETSYLSLIQSFHKEFSFLKSIARKKFTAPIREDFLGFAESNLASPCDLTIGNECYRAKSYVQLANSSLSIKYREYKGKLCFSCDTRHGLLPEYLADSLLSRFFFYLDKLLKDPEAPIVATNLIFEEERRKLLITFNATDSFYPKQTTLLDLFEKVVVKYPHKTAIKAFDGTLSYFELNLRAERLANYLVENGLKPTQAKVAILMDHRLLMIVSIIGVLKTGSAYIPIAHDTPTKRIIYILNDSEIDFLVTLPILAKKITTKVKVIDANQAQAVVSKAAYVKIPIDSNHLACVIYTSGTTGEPKGVLISHRTLVNLTQYYIKEFKISPLFNCSKYAGFGFDASIIETFPALLSGSTLHIIPEHDKKDLTAVKNFFTSNEINFGFLPTQLAELFLESCSADDSIKLKYLIVAGEKLNKFIPVNFHVVNAYGTTETSIHVTSFVIRKKNSSLFSSVPIGKPINNVKCYVVDKNLNLLPIGAIGELVVGGEGLSEGYLNLPDLTMAKFIANPFQSQNEKLKKRNARLYKTGDLVRWLPDGNLDYLGRNDFQVKIRGHRIEVAEIEHKLTNHPKIFQSVILVKQDKSNNKYLVAYYTANKALNELKLQDYLSSILPEYMIPNIFVYLKCFPLTINGKLDRKSLPEPVVKSNNYVSPTNIHEQLICSLFSKILDVNKIGIDDDFFRMGGNSIKTITLVSALQDKCNITVSDVFNLKTPRKIADNILFIENNLKRQLDRIKQSYSTEINEIITDDILNKVQEYQNNIENIIVDKNKREMTNVLLTGVTGFLGCNLLYQLLTTTNHKIFLVVRAPSYKEALNRVYDKFKFYFNKPLTKKFKQRLCILTGNLEKDSLGLPQAIYQALILDIDSIIHCAALTKHYGEQEQFNSANIQATINVLELSRLTASKDFHYISTISILNVGYIPNYDYYVATEGDTGDNLEGCSNLYIKTKYEGEKLAVSYRKYGINSSIYRVGNLAFMANNHHFQQNQEDNSFLYQLKTLVTLGVITKPISTVEISFVDWTAKAIIKLFNNLSLSNQTYHIFNPYTYELTKLFSHNSELSVRQVPFPVFIDYILQLFNDPIYQECIERFLLHKGWLNNYYSPQTKIQVKQDRTQYILEQLNFKWPSRTEATTIIDTALRKYLIVEQEFTPI